jgi:hypothetical protein
MKRLLLLLLSGGLILATPARSQDVSGNLEGSVLDPQGAPVEGAKIILSGPDLQGTRETVTDNRGHFLILALPVGVYTVKIQHPAFQDVSLEKVSVRLGRTSSLGETRLRPKAVEDHEIVVTAERPLIDEASTAGGSSFDIKTVETLPVNRDYRSLTMLLPNVVEGAHGGEANFSGATGLENRYFIDGIDTTDPFRGVGGTALPYNFVKEIEVRTGGYEAEYRSSLGGIVNVITSSGGNTFAGRVFGFFNNDRFSGESRMGVAEPSIGRFSQYDFGASVGGPIVFDKLWFFAAYNPRFAREEVEIPGQGFFRDQNTTHIFAGKLTWQLSPKTNVVLTAVGDPSSRNAVGDTWGTFGTYRQFTNPDPYLETIRRGGVNLSLKGTHIASDSLLFETSISWINRREQNLPATDRGRDERAFYDTETGTLSGGSPGWMNDLSKQATLSAKGTWMIKAHVWKFGLEYRENTLVNDWTWSAIMRYSDTAYIDFLAHSEGTLRNRIPTVFVQDSWTVDRRVRLNFGLRWDGQFLVATDGHVSQRILGQFQPRVGLVYEPGTIGSQKIFASFGRFYEDVMLYAMTFYGTNIGAWQFNTYDHDPRIDPSGGVPSGWQNRIQPEIEGLRGQYYDEVTLGYERAIGKITKARIRGIFRRLGQGLEDGAVDLGNPSYWGNPGSGPLSAFPKLKRRYTALEASIEHFGGRHFSYLASYVLSRNSGNFPGLANEDWGGVANPNAGAAFDLLEMAITNEDGLLPNDRTHVLKLSGSYRVDMGLTIGTHIVWESGTPLNEWGGAAAGPPYRLLMQPRGTAGRTPAVFDLNIRLSYDLTRVTGTRSRPKVFLDIFHVGSQRTPVEYDQVHYLALDKETGDQINPNPTYGLVTRYFPPMSARLGFEVGF